MIVKNEKGKKIGNLIMINIQINISVIIRSIDIIEENLIQNY